MSITSDMLIDYARSNLRDMEERELSLGDLKNRLAVMCKESIPVLEEARKEKSLTNKLTQEVNALHSELDGQEAAVPQRNCGLFVQANPRPIRSTSNG